MPMPNHFKKSTSYHLGCLRLGNISIAVEDGWSVTGYRLDYGPTSTTGFFGGASTTGGTFFSGLDEGISTEGVLVNFTGSSPTFNDCLGANTVSYNGAFNSINFEGAELNSGIVGLAAQYVNKDIIFMEAPLYPMVTSGLTCFYPFTWQYVGYGLSGLTGSTVANPMVDLTFFQNRGNYVNVGRPAGQGRVRGFNGIAFNGVSTRMTYSGSPNILTNSDFTWFLDHAVNVAGSPGGNQYIWTSISGAQKNFAIKYYCATTVGVSMVVETSATTYSSTTTGTNFSGFSSNVGTGNQFSTSFATTKWSVIRKSGSTFNLYWWAPGNSSPYSGLTKMWEVTINDWGYTNSNIPIDMYYNPELNYYTSGSMYTSVFYNRALSELEMRYSLSGVYWTTRSTSFTITGQTFPT
jgi:hypothetical protein